MSSTCEYFYTAQRAVTCDMRRSRAKVVWSLSNANACSTGIVLSQSSLSYQRQVEGKVKVT